MSQTQAIKQHLESGRSITAIEALSEYGCLRLAARIADLRDQGMQIETVMVTYSKDKRFAKYKIA